MSWEIYRNCMKRHFFVDFGLLFTPAPCTCCMASEQAPKCVLFSILCASIVAIHTEIVVSI